MTIEGLPIPWAAARVLRNGFSYNPKGKEKEYGRWQIKSQWNQEILHCPVEIHYTFHMPIAKGTSKVRTQQMLNGIMHHIKKPDVDNLCKFASDCIKGICIYDDSQICKLSAEKIYGLSPKTIIKIFPIHHTDPSH